MQKRGNEVSKAGKMPLDKWLLAGVGAGLAGGLAEVVFMSLYSAISGMSGETVLSLITYTFSGSEFSFGQLGAASGLAIHLLLSAAIGFVFGASMYAMRGGADRPSYGRVAVSGAVVLVGIWAFNFFLLLPQINPLFVSYVPLTAAFLSKLMFGLSLGVYGRLFDASRINAEASRSGRFSGVFAVQK